MAKHYQTHRDHAENARDQTRRRLEAVLLDDDRILRARSAPPRGDRLHAHSVRTPGDRVRAFLTEELLNQ